jgi:hypothetical protein
VICYKKLKKEKIKKCQLRFNFQLFDTHFFIIFGYHSLKKIIMKKITFLLFTLLMGLHTFAQGVPIITMIADGDESGGTPKVLEIYANGTVDFSQYSLQNQTNANTTWGNTFDLSALGTVTDDFVYIYSNGSNNNDPFSANFPSVTTNKIDATSNAILNINGDDRVRIVDNNGGVIDMYGEDGVDGTGTAWEYKDGYAKRLDSTGPDGANFTTANWDFHKGALDGHGAVQDGTTYESLIGIGTYTPSSSNEPSLAITSPSNNQIFDPETTTVNIGLLVQNFNVAQPSNGDGYIVYQFDNEPQESKYDTNDIVLTGLTPGSHHIIVELVDNNGNSLNPAVVAEVTFIIKAYIEVATLADLRAGTMGEYYHVTGESFLLGGTESYGKIKAFLQDDTAGILIYDKNIVFTFDPDTINNYDGFTDLKGQLSQYKGMIQLIPTTDPVFTGNNQPITPQVITAEELNTNHDDYESELIKIENATIGNPDQDLTFVLNKNYDLTDATGTTVLRTLISDIEGVTVPTTTVHVTGIAGEYSGTAQIYPRDDDDFETVAAAIGQNSIQGLNIYPNPVNNGNLYITSDNQASKQVVIYNITGKEVYNKEVENGEAISIRNLKSGIYMIKVIENDKVAVQKLMVR